MKMKSMEKNVIHHRVFGLFVIIVFLAMVKTIKESQRQNRD